MSNSGNRLRSLEKHARDGPLPDGRGSEEAWGPQCHVLAKGLLPHPLVVDLLEPGGHCEDGVVESAGGQLGELCREFDLTAGTMFPSAGAEGWAVLASLPELWPPGTLIKGNFRIERRLSNS